ncbi:MAG: phage holin family protein [Candidatus Levybacteria bacterium]|nr:phage holin family protein [Candidatus Levybacteria bacterium]
MKSLIRDTAISSLSLFVLPQIVAGFKISEGLGTIVLGGLVFSLMYKILKPIFNIVSLPLNMMTLGLFSFFSNAIILYLLTIILPQIQVQAFTFPGFSRFGFVIPSMSFNTLFAYVISAGILSLLIEFIKWLIRK